MLAWRSGHVSGMTGDMFNWPIKSFYAQNILRNEGDLFDWLSGCLLLSIGLIGLCGLGFRRNPQLIRAALILIFAFVMLPRVILGSAYADMRLAPYMIAVLLLALMPANRRLHPLIAIAAVGFFVVRMAIQTESYVRIDQGYRGQLAALDHLPRGARVFALADLECIGHPNSPRLDHMEAMGIVRREAFTNGQWTMAGAQLLRVDFPGASGFSGDPSQILRPGRCRQPNSFTYPAVLGQFPRAAFDYLWLINFTPERRPAHDAGLVPVWQGPRGALYRIRRTPSGG
jgi:hypothetical protein